MVELESYADQIYKEREIKRKIKKERNSLLLKILKYFLLSCIVVGICNVLCDYFDSFLVIIPFIIAILLSIFLLIKKFKETINIIKSLSFEINKENKIQTIGLTVIFTLILAYFILFLNNGTIMLYDHILINRYQNDIKNATEVYMNAWMDLDIDTINNLVAQDVANIHPENVLFREEITKGNIEKVKKAQTISLKFVTDSSGYVKVIDYFDTKNREYEILLGMSYLNENNEKENMGLVITYKLNYKGFYISEEPEIFYALDEYEKVYELEERFKELVEEGKKIVNKEL